MKMPAILDDVGQLSSVESWYEVVNPFPSNDWNVGIIRIVCFSGDPARPDDLDFDRNSDLILFLNWWIWGFSEVLFWFDS